MAAPIPPPRSCLMAFHPHLPRYAFVDRFDETDLHDTEDIDADGSEGWASDDASGGQRAVTLLSKIWAWAAGETPRRRRPRPLPPHEPDPPVLRFASLGANGRPIKSPLALKHEFMVSVRCIAWSPLSEMIAVGAETGVCLWRIFDLDSDPGPDASVGWMAFLPHPRHLPIRDLSWHPNGRQLVSISPDEAALLVWDVALRTAVPVWTPRPSVAVEWSPMGGHLFAAFEGGMFAVWETARWNMERFDYPGRFCAAAWASDGMRLAIVLDHLDVEDRCWVVDEMAPGPGSQGGVDWTPSTFLNDLDSGLGPLLGGYHGDSRFVRVVKDVNDKPGVREEDVDRRRVFGDKEILVGTLQTHADSPEEFLMDFDMTRLPPVQEVSAAFGVATPPLPSSAVQSLSWSADEGVLLVSFYLALPGRPYGMGALAAYTVRENELNLAPLQLIDMRKTRFPPRSVSLWQGDVQSSPQLLLGAAWGEHFGPRSGDDGEDPIPAHVELYHIPSPGQL